MQSRKLAMAVVLAISTLSVPAAQADSGGSAYLRPGRMGLASVASDGTQGNATSFVPSVSADGRHVVFWSAASNLVPGDTNKADDVFVHDRITGTTERVSVASDGSQATAGPSGIGSSHASISADGRHVAFISASRDLVPGDTNGVTDVFVHDRETRTTERVSLSTEGAQGNGSSLISPAHPPPILTADGRYLVFYSSSSNLVPGDANGRYDVFLRDRVLRTTERISLTHHGEEANGNSFSPSISADGRHVAFHSDATNLVPGDTNESTDVFVRDREQPTTERVSVATDGTQGDGGFFGAQYAAISAEGRHVVFYSWSGKLVPSDTNETADVFVHDRETRTTERVSVASDGTEGNSSSGYASISATGRHVAFYSNASNLVPDDTNKVGAGGQDVFVHDRETKATERVSLSDDGAQGDNGSWFSSISADGRHVAFQSFASNLVPDDTNTWGTADAFVRDRGPALGVGGISAFHEAGAVSAHGWATFSGQEVAAATDPDDDGASTGPLRARELGAELEGATLLYRVEQSDLLVRWRLASLPGPAQLVGVGISYRLDIGVGALRYEVRAARAEAAAATSSPHFALYRCDPGCSRQEAILTGSIGTVGPEVRVSVPLSALGVEEGALFHGIRAFTMLGDGTTGALMSLDDVALPDAQVPRSRVLLGIAPLDVPEEEVVFETETALTQGAFAGTVGGANAVPPGQHRVWARACLGQSCGTNSVLLP